MSKFDQAEIKRLCMNHQMIVKEVYTFPGGNELIVFLHLSNSDEINRLVFVESNVEHSHFASRSILQWRGVIAEDSGIQFFSNLESAVASRVKCFSLLCDRFNLVQRKVESLLVAN